MTKFYFLLFWIIPTFSFGHYDTITNSINQSKLITEDISHDFSFLVAGHAYGAPSNSIYPCQSLVNYIENINSSHSNFLMLLGDNYRIADSLNILTFKNTFLNKLQLPVFNALGNHDIHPRNYSIYKENFTKNTYFSFKISSSLFIVLDTELDNSKGFTDGSITSDQLQFLKKTISQFTALNSPVVKNIFICTHKALNLSKTNNFEKDTKPLLSSIPKDYTIFVLSGDMSQSPSDLYTIEDYQTNIRYIHTHLSDSKNDKILSFKVTDKGVVHITPISLHNLPVKALESYEFSPIQNKNIEPSFFQKLKIRLYNPIFYQGILFVIICFILFKFIYKRKK